MGIKAEHDRRLDLFINALLDPISFTTPDLVLLTGEMFRVFGDPGETVVRRIERRLADFSFFSHSRRPEVRFKDLETRVVATGVCYQMIREKWEYHEELTSGRGDAHTTHLWPDSDVP